MAATFAPYVYATACTSGPEPGTKVLLAYILSRYETAFSMGIYNCRTVRGGATTSIHSEGRALDVGFPTVFGKANPLGTRLVNEILRIGPSRLGIQCIIWDRKIWSAKSPESRAYGGVHPHYDHVHIEMTRSGAAALNAATVKALFDGLAPAPAWARRPTLRKGSQGKHVVYLQQRLNAAGVRYEGKYLLREDGDFGAKTFACVVTYQRYRKVTPRLVPNGVVDTATWRALY